MNMMLIGEAQGKRVHVLVSVRREGGEKSHGHVDIFMAGEVDVEARQKSKMILNFDVCMGIMTGSSPSYIDNYGHPPTL